MQPDCHVGCDVDHRGFGFPRTDQNRFFAIVYAADQTASFDTADCLPIPRNLRQLAAEIVGPQGRAVDVGSMPAADRSAAPGLVRSFPSIPGTTSCELRSFAAKQLT